MKHAESSGDTTEIRAEELDGNNSQLAPEKIETYDGVKVEQPRSRFSSLGQRQWLLIGGAVLLIGTGLGWRWWQASNTQAPAGEAQPQGVQVKLSTLGSSTVRETSEYVASLESPESVTLQPQVEGRVTQILAREGDRVTAGTPILQVDPEEQAAAVGSVSAAAEAAQAEVENARATLASLQAERVTNLSDVRFNQREYERYASLAAQGAVSRQIRDQYTNRIQTARANLAAINQRIQAQRSTVARTEKAVSQAQANTQEQQVQLNYFRLRAPIDGTVGDIPVQVGDLVNTSTQMVTITQNQSLEVNISVPTERAAELRLGLPVELINAEGQTVGTSRISFISPSVNNQNQSVLARSIFDNSAGRLRTDQFTRARVIWNQRPGILIPVTAITRLGGETFVFVAASPQKPANEQSAEQSQSSQPQLIARQKRVKLGPIQGNNYQVVEGLQPGERLITSGILNLKDSAPITPGS